ncbi:MAG: hypothetical protein EU530_04600 [Promethearchaeota archaeon]|nr:MAG: hypothetical protein EU530_04600 [Candidatus Lokiarchaeota archaeon]
MSRKEKKFRKLYERWVLYSKITDLGEIARRYFVNNFFDGVLTVLGIIIGYFVLFINGTVYDSRSILVPSISVAVAIGISGITGGYLAEKAERDAEFIQIRRSMCMQTEIKRNHSVQMESYYPKVELKESNIEFEADFNVEQLSVGNKKETDSNIEPDRTITEDALKFATNIASLINGVAPALGGLVGIIPFLFIEVPSIETYIAFFILNTVVLFLLGAYLSHISEDSVWKYGPIMVLTGVLTAALSILLGV